MYKKGFTLIELMVVIAIIAILATVVLVSLGSARDAAEDANRSSAISQFRSLSEVFYARSDNLDYQELWDGTADELQELVKAYGIDGDFAATIDTSDSKEVLRVNSRQGTDPNFKYDEYCAQIELTNETTFLCVDSNLAIRRIDNVVEGDLGPCFEDGATDNDPLYECR